MTERIYGLRELTRILTLTPRRAAQLKRLDLLHGKSGYTFRELLALRAAAALLDAGAAVRQIRDALEALKRKDPTRGATREMRSARRLAGSSSTACASTPAPAIGARLTPATARRPRTPLVNGPSPLRHRGEARRGSSAPAVGPDPAQWEDAIEPTAAWWPSIRVRAAWNNGPLLPRLGATTMP